MKNEYSQMPRPLSTCDLKVWDEFVNSQAIELQVVSGQNIVTALKIQM